MQSQYHKLFSNHFTSRSAKFRNLFSEFRNRFARRNYSKYNERFKVHSKGQSFLNTLLGILMAYRYLL